MQRIEIITVGDELVDGRLVDRNSAHLSSRLAEVGLNVARHHSVGDDPEEIAEVLCDAAARSAAVLVTGGLGPTSDDLTAAAAALAFGVPVERHPLALQQIQEFFSSRGREMSPSNATQADLPQSCGLIPNPDGTAVGFTVDAGHCRLYFLPGVPAEARAMMEGSVLPELLERLRPRRPQIATLKVFGRTESEVGELLAGLAIDPGDDLTLTVQYRATFPEIHVRLVVDGEDGERGRATLAALVAEASERLGPSLFARGGRHLEPNFPDVVMTETAESGARVATAESLPGGALAGLCGVAKGAGEAHAGSVVLAPGQRWTPLLGDRSGPGSDPATAEELAVAVRERTGATWGVAVSPAGEHSAEGTFRVAVASADGCEGRDFRFPLPPARLARLAAYIALLELRRRVR